MRPLNTVVAGYPRHHPRAAGLATFVHGLAAATLVGSIALVHAPVGAQVVPDAAVPEPRPVPAPVPGAPGAGAESGSPGAPDAPDAPDVPPPGSEGAAEGPAGQAPAQQAPAEQAPAEQAPENQPPERQRPGDRAPADPDGALLLESPPAPQPAPLGQATGAAAASSREADTAPAEDEASPELPRGGFGAVAVAPPPGAATPLARVPRNVLGIDRALIETQHPLGLHDALELRLGGVVLNDVQSNPLQRDLQYRGFSASPLLGTPQGLSVFQNGVRVNEVFGDVVQWDTIPEIAVDEVQLIPGANPLYGLNALGGSLALRMKNGYRFQGHRVVGYGGSFGRHVASGELGKQLDGWAFYGAVSRFGEQGFRDASRASATRAYADLRRTDAHSEVGVNVTLADTDLNGNGLAPVELLASEGRGAVYTYPDNTQNRMLMVAGDLDHDLASGASLQATAYVRHLERDTLNGDEAEFEVCDGAMQSVLCDEDGEALSSEAGGPVVIDTAVNALFNTSATTTDTYGGTLQLAFDQDLAGTPNQLLVGATYDGGHVAFLQRAETGFLTADRTVLGDDVFLAGDAFRTDLQAHSHHVAGYLADTWTPVEPLSLQVSARFGWANVELVDQADSGALDGDHDFRRVSPAAGITYRPVPALTLFASYAESNRVPSAAELACADPDEPCRVPNAFVADPPLSQVVSRGGELGLRGYVGDARRPLFRYAVAGFASRNFDDILFVAGSRVGTGYFRNAGQTQRLGLEVDVSGEAGPVRFFASYALLRATFESELSLPGHAHPALGGDADGGPGAGDDDNDDDDDDDDDDGPSEGLSVTPGDRIPGLPTHSMKAGVTLTVLPGWEVGVSVIARSGAPFRGDEANLLPDLPGYATLGAYTSYRVLESLSLFVKGQNLLDTDYETFGALAEPDEVLPGTSDPRFVGPGAPLAVFAGLVLASD